MLQEIQDQGGGRCCLLYGLLEEQEVQPAHGVPEEEEMQPVVSVPEAIKLKKTDYKINEQGLRMSLS